jgi:nitrate reductase gamma subunit
MTYGTSSFASDVFAATARRTGLVALWLVLSLHGLAMILMGETEATPLGMAVFVLVWAMMNLAGRVRAEVADHASVVQPDHALAQAAFLELAFLEGLAEVAAPVGQDECSRVAVHDRTSL